MHIWGKLVVAAALMALPMTMAGAAQASAAAVPNANIVLVSGGLKYSPTSLLAHWSGAKDAPCTATNLSFTVTNNTTYSRTMTLGGKPFVTIAAHKQVGICAFGTGQHSTVFAFSRFPHATLTVHEH